MKREWNDNWVDVVVEDYKIGWTYGQSAVDWEYYMSISNENGVCKADQLFGQSELDRLNIPADASIYLHQR